MAFELKERNTQPPVGYKHIPMKMIFDIKIYFTRKARLVAEGHKTNPPISLTYSMVFRDSVRMAFLIPPTNNLNIMMAGIGNAHLNAKTEERVYAIAGPEFGDADEGKIAVIVQALYGLKSSGGAAWQAHFASTLRDIGFIPSYADPDMWYREATSEESTMDHYEYILVHVDYILCIAKDPAKIINSFAEPPYLYRLKDVGPPTIYVGAKISRHQLNNDRETWFISA